MYKYFILLFCLMPLLVSAQDSDADSEISNDEEKVHQMVTDWPEPVDGISAIYYNLNYPENARRQHIEGTVVVSFVVRKDSTVTDAEIVRSRGEDLDNAAIEAIKNTEWIPGYLDGEAVNTQFQLPIRFRLQR